MSFFSSSAVMSRVTISLTPSLPIMLGIPAYMNEGIQRFNGNKELYEKFLTSFPEDIHYEQMLEAIEQKDVDAAFQGAHALKGITGTVSLAKLHRDRKSVV